MLKSMFPYTDFKNNETIVVYGYGARGKEYERIINRGRFANILYFVDRNYEEINDCKVKPVESLVEDQDRYNFVIISLADVEDAKRVKACLVNMGVAPDKVKLPFYQIETFQLDNTSKEELKGYIHNQYNRLKDVCVNAMDYYPLITDTIDKYGCEDKRILSFLKDVISDMENTHEKVIVLCLMLYQHCFDAQCMQMLFESLLKMEWKDDTAYGILCDTSLIAFFMHSRCSCFYDGYQNDRNKLMLKLIDHYKLWNTKPMLHSNANRIAIMAAIHYDYGNYYVIDRIIDYYAKNFVELGYEVKIFSVGAFVPLKRENVFLSRKIEHGNILLPEKTTDDMDVHYSLNNDVRTRMKLTIDAVYAFNPTYIIDMADECFFEGAVLKDSYPILYMPMRSNAYNGFFHGLVTRDYKRCVKENERYKVCPNEVFLEEQLGSLISERETVTYSKQEVVGKDDAFVLVTVGTRLSIEIDTEMIKAVCRLLASNCNFRWLIIGDEPICDLEVYEKFVQNGNIVLWGWEKNLESLYRVCDVYLQPKRTGGGVSIRQAMSAGLPIIISEYPSDVLPLIPPEYIVHGGYEEMMAFARTLCSDKKFYSRVSKNMHKVVESFSAIEDAKKVLRACKRAEKNFFKAGF